MGNVVKGDCKPEDLSALSKIMGQPTSAVSFGASTLVREEIEQIPQEYRGPHVQVYETLRNFASSKVTWANESDLNTILTDRRYLKAQEILSERTDAHLVVDALNEGRRNFPSASPYFLTTDYKTLLSHKTEIETEFPIKVVSPSQLRTEWWPEE